MIRHYRIKLIFGLVLVLFPIAGFGWAGTGSAPLVVTDQSGRTISVKKPFCRIISLYGAHTENLFRLGLDEEIIGVSRSEVYPPEALKKPVFSYHDDLEKFLAAQPDLVLVRPMIDRGYAPLTAGLEKHGITVVSLQPGTPEAMYAYWQALGHLTGKTDRAIEMTERFQSTVSRFRSLTETVPNKKRVYFEAIHSRMKTFSPDSMAIFALESAGGINVAADARPVRGTNIAEYGKERILSRGSEIDVFLAQHGTMNRPTLELITREPGFQVIRAVRDGRVYIIDEGIVSRPTFRLLSGIFEIGKILYPDIFDKSARTILETANEG